MSGQSGGNIISEGLVFAIDPANNKSYIGSGTNISDLTRNSGDGTLTNGVAFNNNSFSFDGVNDYINFGNIGFIPKNGYTGGFSVGVWFKVNPLVNLTDTANILTLVQLSQIVNNVGGFAISVRGGIYNGLLIEHPFPSGTFGQMSSNIDIRSSLLNGGYHNFVFNKNDNGSAKVYFNGTEISSRSTGFYSSATLNTTHTVKVGHSYGSFYHNGNVSNVQLYNRALSAQEILQNYNALKGRFQ